MAYGSIIYDKSPIMLMKLIEQIGEANFRKGIQKYLQTYAFDNASWDDLINIFDAYTEQDLTSWSKAWVYQRGMPSITVERQQDNLIFKQAIPFGQALPWKQSIQIQVGKKRQTIEMNDMTVSIKSPTHEPMLINTNGKGYANFVLTNKMINDSYEHLCSSERAVERGAMLILLYENFQQGSIKAPYLCEKLLNYAVKEENPLLFSLALGYVKSATSQCDKAILSDVEKRLWALVKSSTDGERAMTAFRTYVGMAQTPSAIKQLHDIWQKQQTPLPIPLSETDYTNLAYKLAIYQPSLADHITQTQAQRITNPDRQQAFRFIAPSTSPRKAERDSVFQSLMHAENRRIEPWASQALRNLNAKPREKEAVAYIRPALDELTEIQRTGDIFFPTNWLNALLSQHQSREAYQEIETFFAENPGYCPMLTSKIKQQADHFKWTKKP